MVWVEGFLTIWLVVAVVVFLLTKRRDAGYRLGYWLELGMVPLFLAAAVVDVLHGRHVWPVIEVVLAGVWFMSWVTDPRGKARRDNMVRFFRKEKMV